MSEYQYIAFRAIDAAVSEKNLGFMRKQSSRAEITPWSFENEYHFGDFRGDDLEMLRRGYDFHLHFANFGVRKLMIRFPAGLPDTAAAEPYFEKDALHFIKDKSGCGGILCLEPYYEVDDLDDQLDLEGLLDRLLPLRSEIQGGDLRPLYLARLAVAFDSQHDAQEETDPPVPAGLEKLTGAQSALSELYGLSDALIAAAAQDAPRLPNRSASENPFAAWLERQPEAMKNAWLNQWMADSRAPVRNEILAEYQKTQSTPLWPTINLKRTVAEIMLAAEQIQHERDHKSARQAAQQRAKILAGMAADPMPTLRKTEGLVTHRNLDAYSQIALLLADLREALTDTDRSALAEEHARHLKVKNPTLHHLTAELRRQGFLQKSSK